jgi:hypothetical protein
MVSVDAWSRDVGCLGSVAEGAAIMTAGGAREVYKFGRRGGRGKVSVIIVRKIV